MKQGGSGSILLAWQEFSDSMGRGGIKENLHADIIYIGGLSKYITKTHSKKNWEQLGSIIIKCNITTDYRRQKKLSKFRLGKLVGNIKLI